MGVSKVVYGDNTLVDLTNDSVSAATLAKGVTAHNAAGDQVTGIMEAGTSVTKETITEALGYTPTKAWYVTFTADDDDNVTADKTIAEIYQAYQDGYAVYGLADNMVFQLSALTSKNDSMQYTVPLIMVSSNNAYFSGVVYNGINYVLLQLVCSGSECDFYILSGSELYATKAEIPDETTLVDKVLAALPTWTGGSY